MGKVYAEITPELAAWLVQQKVFFVGSAPLSADGHVNVSPKGLDTLRVLGPRRVAYLDLTGSGAETIAHLRENGRITILFCAFEGPPKIVRLHGRGEAVFPGEPAWDALAARFPAALVAGPGVRSIVRVRLSRVSDSCGYGVPRMRFEGERDQLLLWAERKGVEGTREYRRERNAKSLDGLPGFPSDAGK
jgi:hypothetical protein